MWIAYAMTTPPEAGDSVKAQLEDCDRVCARYTAGKMRPFIDREPAGGFFDGGRPNLMDAIAFARKQPGCPFVVASVERLSDDIVDRSLVIALLLAAGVEGLYTPNDGKIDTFPIMWEAQDVIRGSLAEVEQLRTSVVGLEQAKESLKKTLIKRRDTLRRRRDEMRSLRSEPSSLVASLLCAIHRCGLSVNAIANAAGVPQPVLHRFVKGERGITLKTAEKVFNVLGVRFPPAD